MQADLFAKTYTATKAPLMEVPPLPSWSAPVPMEKRENHVRWAISMSAEFIEVIAATIHKHGGPITDKQIKALLPDDWKDLLQGWAHGHLTDWQAKKHGIHAKYVQHDDYSHHFEYQPITGHWNAP